MMSSRPTRNDSLDWEKNDEGEVQISVVRQDTWKVRLLSKLFYIPKKRKITLDEVGTEVWQMCNGRNTVGDMIEQLSETYQLNRKEAEVSLLQYLKTLGEKRFIGFVLEGEKGPPDPGGASGKKWIKK
ncbi:MAG: PqqD family protein [Candidatus Latescibacterota bacterium]|nr:PqqD family protein [Candidatus Latescibacterota bacterium]